MMQQTCSPLGSPTGNDNEELHDLSLSDSPLAMSKQRRAASVPGTAATAARKQPMSMRGPSRMKIGSGSSGKRAGRPPSPLIARRAQTPERVTLKDPELVTGGEADLDIEGKMKMIVEQQKMDHEFLHQVAAAVRALGGAVADERAQRVTGIEEATQLGVNLRRELYAVRDQIGETIQRKIPEATQEIFTKGGPGFILGSKLEEAQTALAVLQLHVASLTNQEEQVENYITGLHQERPREGQAIEGFVHSEVGQVREMVKKLETSGVVGGTNLHYVPFTKEMGEHIRKLEDTINQHTYQVNEQQRGYNLMAETINKLQTEQGGHAQRLLTASAHQRHHRAAHRAAHAAHAAQPQDGLRRRRSGSTRAWRRPRVRIQLRIPEWRLELMASSHAARCSPRTSQRSWRWRRRSTSSSTPRHRRRQRRVPLHPCARPHGQGRSA